MATRLDGTVLGPEIVSDLGKRLEAEREDLRARLAGFAESEESIDDAAVAAQLRVALDAVGAALESMAKGAYGRCTDCEQPIPLNRLLAMPQAVRCIACQARAERPARS